MNEVDLTLVRELRAIEPLVGNTPLYDFSKYSENREVKIFAKMEWLQLGANVSTRPAYNIIKSAVISGQLDRERILIDVADRALAVSYAVIGAKLGLTIHLFIEGELGEETQRFLTKLGTKFTLDLEIEGDVNKHAALLGKEPQYFFANHKNNELNWRSHYDKTAFEIVRQTGGAISHFASITSSTGPFEGNVKRFRKLSTKIKCVAINDEHETERSDELVSSDADLVDFIDEMVRKEGLFLTPDGARNILGSIQLSKQVSKGTIVTILPDINPSILN